MSQPDPDVDAVVIEARGLAKTYRRGPEEVHALRDVTFAVRAGELVAVRGPSGSGKTTLLNVLAGWEAPDAGELRVAAGSPASAEWARTSLVPQRLGLLDELTIEENVALPLRLRPGDPGADGGRVPRALAELGLDELADRSPGETSLGQQQRAAIARALVLRPAVVLADEPTGHQDAAWAGAILAALRAGTAAGTACVVATHSDDVAATADRVLRLEDGRLTPDD